MQYIRPARLAVLVGLAGLAALDGRGEYAEVNGARLYYEVHGEGEPLLLLHGFNGSGRVFAEFVPEYSKEYRVIVPDLRGHGRSTNPTAEFTHRQAARDIFGLLDQLELRQVRGVGTSTGGMTLLHMATQQPERIEAMVVVGATIYFPDEARAIMRRRDPSTITPEDMARAREVHLLGDEQIRALRRQFHGFKDSYDDMNFTAPYLGTIQARTLVVHGDRDEFFPVQIPFEMYRSIPRAYLWVVPNGGHGPHREHAREFLRMTKDFLAGHWK